MTPSVTPESVVEDYLKAPLDDVRGLRWEMHKLCPLYLLAFVTVTVTVTVQVLAGVRAEIWRLQGQDDLPEPCQ